MPDQESNSKELYEIEKLKIELSKLKAPWYKQIQHWSLITTSILAFGTFILLIKNGAFSFKSEELEAKRENLQNDINKFAHQKVVLQKAIDSMLLRVNVLLDMNDSMTITLQNYEEQINKDLNTVQQINQMAERSGARLDSVMRLHKKSKKRR